MELKKMRDARGYTAKQLGDMVGVSDAAISMYENGMRKPSYDVFLKLAEVLGCSLGELAGIEELKDFGFTAYEQMLIKKYRTLDEIGKKCVEAVLDVEAGRNEAAVPVPKTKIIPLFGSAFAAGSFEPGTQAEPFTDYEVDAGSKAEFAIRVSGDSMEPELHDGEIALCRKRTPSVGEIGVFLFNGSFYVKQFITDGWFVYLRSVNRKRKDSDLDISLSADTDLRCFGSVIHRPIPLVKQ